MTKDFRGGVLVSDLTWTPFGSTRPLLKEISLEILPGEKVLLVGPSGSGKSTLLRAIAGVLSDSESGEISGRIESSPSGLLLQDPNDSLVSDTIYREVAFGLENSGAPTSSMPGAARQALNSVSLDKPLEHPSTDLSGGEMQRMAFAGVLAMQPELVLLDEPTSMLDVESADSVRAAVRSHLAVHKSTMILVEHRFGDWLPLVERLIVLGRDGQIIFDGEPAHILRSHRDKLLELGIWVPGEPAPAHPRINLPEPRVGSQPGKLTVLTGRSGAGKTTELKQRMAADFKGNGLIDRIGYVPQQPELTVIGNSVIDSANITAALADGLLGRSAAEARGRTLALLAALGVAELAEQNPHEVSGGEQRRIALASALAHNPRALYLDEPTVGQDRDAWASIIATILAARDSGVQVTVATHDQELIELADERVVISASASNLDRPAKSLVSGLVVLAAPILLLLGSMAVTTVARGVSVLTVEFIAGLVLFLSGLRLQRPRVLIPGFIGVASIGFSNWYLSSNLQFDAGLIAAMRVSSFVVPGIVLATQLKPIAVGDQLGQVLRLPARPVVAAAAALQRLASMMALWDELRFIHRIRGLAIGRTPLARFSEFARLVFALLIQSIRSAGTTAVAMDARGFSRMKLPRTWALRASWARLDLLVMCLAVVAAISPWLAR
jgi:energy-coupling factor transport system permease/ATP-binding protein